MSTVTSHGYRLIRVVGHPAADQRGWGYEHRIVAWDAFGPFDMSMHVHHKNGDKLDNRPENLEIISAREHLREHKITIDRQEIVRLYATGMTVADVARAVGADPSATWRALTSEGVTIRTDGRGQYAGINDDDLRTLCTIPDIRVRQIADVLGVSKQAVRNHMKRLGIPPFPVGGPSTRWQVIHIEAA